MYWGIPSVVITAYIQKRDFILSKLGSVQLFPNEKQEMQTF